MRTHKLSNNRNFAAANRFSKQQNSGKPQNIDPAQRKILITNTERPGLDSDGDEVKTATADEYLRFYQSEEEMQSHLVKKEKVPVGLIKRIALWYRLPTDITDNFFVFGESHSGVKGKEIQKESHFTKPILDEGLTGWTSGSPQTEPSSPVSDEKPPPANEGLDENGAKLLRGIEYVISYTEEKIKSLTEPATDVEPTLPLIPTGEKSTRISKDGTYKLVIGGEDGKEKLWSPKVPVPSSTYNTASESKNAVTGLFPVVFKKQIEDGKLKDVGEGLEEAWNLYSALSTKETPNELEMKEQLDHLKVIKSTVEKHVAERYNLDYINKGVGLLTNPKVYPRLKQFGLDNALGGNRYRDEYMLLRVKKAADENNFAFATMGDSHRERLQSRLNKIKVPSIPLKFFYSPDISRDAVDI